jgi:hypothetical protein
MSYIILRGRWFCIIVLNLHVPIEDKIGNVKGSFYDELERIIDKFPNNIRNFFWEISIPKKAEKTFLNLQLG